MLSKSGQSICQPGLDRPQREFKNRGDFLQRHLLLKVQNEDGTTCRRQGVAVQQLLQKLTGRCRLLCGHRVEHGLVLGLFPPAFFFAKVTKSRAAGDSKCPWSKELGRLQPREFPAHENEDILQDIVGVTSADETRQVPV